MKPGIYDNISNAEYHGGPGVSNSGLALIRRSPLHFRAATLAANDNATKESTAAQAIGTAFHALMLEPELFVRDYCLGLRQSDYPRAIDSRDQLVAMVAKLNETRLPKLSTTGTKDELVARILDALDERDRTPAVVAEFQSMKGAELKANLEELNAVRPGLLPTTGTIPQLAQLLRDNGEDITLWSDIKAEWLKNNGHRTVLEPEEWDQLHRMREAVLAHPAARALMLAPGKAEQSVYWIDQETGVLCRCRPDKWLDTGYIADLKTADDASPQGFAKSMANWAYDVQDAYYTDGCAAVGKPLKGFLFVVVEKGARLVDGRPIGVAVYRLSDTSRDLGRAKYRASLRKYAECVATNNWPCYGDRIQEIDLPTWEFTKNAHLLESA
jgi:exodeoxyribonuclease VIII